MNSKGRRHGDLSASLPQRLINGFALMLLCLAASMFFDRLFPTLPCGDSLTVPALLLPSDALAYGAVMARGACLIPFATLATLIYDLWLGASPFATLLHGLAFVLTLLFVLHLSRQLVLPVNNRRMRHLLRIPLIAVVCATLMAPLASLQFSNQWPNWPPIIAFWLGEATSILLFTPIARTLFHPCRHNARHDPPWSLRASLGWLAIAVMLLAIHALWHTNHALTLGWLSMLCLLPPVLVAYLLPPRWSRSGMAAFLTGWLVIACHQLAPTPAAVDQLLALQLSVLVAALIGFLCHELARNLESTSRRLAATALEDSVTGLCNSAGLSRFASDCGYREAAVIGVQIDDIDDLEMLIGNHEAQRVEYRLAQTLRGCEKHLGGCAARLRPGLMVVLVPCRGDTEKAGVNATAEALAQRLDDSRPQPAIAAARLGIHVVLIERLPLEALPRLAALLLRAVRQAPQQREALYRCRESVTTLIEQQRLAARWSHRLRSSLAGNECQGQLVLFAQPVVSRHTPHSARCEILLRWQSPAGELTGPNDFLPVAEACRLMPQIDAWVIEQTLAQLACHPQGRRLESVAINLSGQTLGCEWLKELIIRTLERYRWPPQRLCLEITETVPVRNQQRAGETLDALRALGVRVAIDDFGTGRAAFDYLKRFPLDLLKIDGTFVRQLGESELDREVVRTTCTLARQLRARVVAEFVESAEQMALLTGLGVDYFQGFGLARPMALTDYLDSLDRLAEGWMAQHDALHKSAGEGGWPPFSAG
ncbi:EAL domain-containing protein [Kushneria aurantia]|uniref:EAL domain-containing protein n=1 Tax=Kushneria aurantia TaxID=504092 RepID=A0ABV6G098_9GAMM|nr:EAL domain-containing protein [Kushneria aurantia]